MPRTAIDYVWFWCVIPLQQILVFDILTLMHGQFQTEYSVHLVGPELNIYILYCFNPN
jgi:hypothetical protein